MSSTYSVSGMESYLKGVSDRTEIVQNALKTMSPRDVAESLGLRVGDMQSSPNVLFETAEEALAAGNDYRGSEPAIRALEDFIMSGGDNG